MLIAFVLVVWHQWEYSSTRCHIAFFLSIRRFLNLVKDHLLFISLHACLIFSTAFLAFISAFICLDNAPVLVSWTWRPAVVPITQGPAVCRFSRPDRRLTRPSPLPRALPSLRPSRWTLSSLNLCFVSYLYISAQKLVSFVWSKWGFHCCRFFCLFFYKCIFKVRLSSLNLIMPILSYKKTWAIPLRTLEYSYHQYNVQFI